MPSEKTLSAKKERVAQLVEMLKNSAAGVLVDYKGITVEEDTKLRKELREAGVSYFVEKNTILRFALKEAGLDGITNVLEGTTAIAISNDDQTAPARILGKFASLKTVELIQKTDRFSCFELQIFQCNDKIHSQTRG